MTWCLCSAQHNKEKPTMKNLSPEKGEAANAGCQRSLIWEIRKCLLFVTEGLRAKIHAVIYLKLILMIVLTLLWTTYESCSLQNSCCSYRAGIPICAQEAVKTVLFASPVLRVQRTDPIISACRAIFYHPPDCVMLMGVTGCCSLAASWWKLVHLLYET